MFVQTRIQEITLSTELFMFWFGKIRIFQFLAKLCRTDEFQTGSNAPATLQILCSRMQIRMPRILLPIFLKCLLSTCRHMLWTMYLITILT